MRHPSAILTRAGLAPVLVALAVLALAGCSQRERANPLDPGNPLTGGRPTGFNAVASYAQVQLTWTSQPNLAIDGYQLFRVAPGDSVWRPLSGVLPLEVSRYLDAGLPNGQRVRYRLDYVIGGAAAGRPVEDEATPGALRPWVTDPGASAILQLSPDGRDVSRRETRFGRAARIAVDPVDGFLWVSSLETGRVWAWDPRGFAALMIAAVPSPDAMAISPFDNSAWICDRGGVVWHFSRDGTVPTPGRLSPFEEPGAIATCALDASVWICERGGNRVRHYSAAGVPLGAAFVQAPSRVAVDSLTRVAYVTSFTLGRIWRIAENGALIDSTSAAVGPIGIAIDRARNRVWVADTDGARVLGLDLATLAVAQTITNVGSPYDLAVDTSNGDVWVVARANGAVLRLASDGTRRDILTGLSDPYEIKLDPGQ